MVAKALVKLQVIMRDKLFVLHLIKLLQIIQNAVDIGKYLILLQSLIIH